MPVDGLLPLAGVVACALAAWLTRATSATGALAGAAVGAAVAAGTGWTGFGMLAALLVVGTLISRKGHRERTVLQVLCNGGVAAAASVAAGFGASWGLLAAGGALATALSDTVSGEVGQRWGGAPRWLLLGPRAPEGADGGMTWLGTAAGLPAAALVPLMGRLEPRQWWIIAAAGVGGNLIDSLAGATLQRHLGARGNDWVNLAATLCGGALAVALT